MGTTIPQLVFACCQFCPNKSFIEYILELEKTMSMTELVKTVLDYNVNGYTCLLVLFDMMIGYNNQTGNLPGSSLPMFLEIETTAFYLIKLAEDNKLPMDDILNWTADNGLTLFQRAAWFSESLASELLKKDVIVTTVDILFQTPSFRVSLKFIDLV